MTVRPPGDLSGAPHGGQALDLEAVPQECSHLVMRLDALGRSIESSARLTQRGISDEAPAFARLVAHRRLVRIWTCAGAVGGGGAVVVGVLVLWWWLSPGARPPYKTPDGMPRVEELIQRSPANTDTPVGWPTLSIIRSLNMEAEDDRLILPVQERARSSEGSDPILTPLADPDDN